MGYFWSSSIGYYEGDKIRNKDIEVTKRPSTLHSWNGFEWIEDSQLVKLSNIVKLEKTDQGFVRVVEDIINILIEKDIINIRDFPEAVQEKYKNRKSLRDKING